MVSSPTLAIFLPSLAGGGAERMMLNLAAGALAEGLTVALVCADARGPYLSEVPSGCLLVDLKARRVLLALPKLAAWLRRERPRVLLAAMDHANLVAIWARVLAGADARVRLAVSVRSQLSMAAANEPHLRGRLLPRLARWFYPQADDVIAVSQGVADDLVQCLGLDHARITVIPNPVVGEQLETLAAAPLAHPWFAPEAPPVVLAAGRLTRQKDFPTLLRAFARLVPRRDLRLVILGEGPDRGALTAEVDALGLAERVALPGFDDNPFRWMARARLFVLSSAWEGLPGVLIQAMACGTPVVSTDCPSGPREVLDGGRFGDLVPVGDAAALAAAMENTLDDPLPAAALKAHAAQYRIAPVTRQYLAALGLADTGAPAP
jgi:glycosyltransferase involved in cell wall biosynthesis